MAVEDTGGPLKAPVGKGVLARMFDVFGNAIDRGAALSDVQWRSVHQAPPPLARRSTKSEIFETGIKVIDVLVPLERGGKAGLFGGGGRRQDGAPHRDDPQHDWAPRGRQSVLRYR
jgi:F-type H+-transporting ATPase subunit beta